MIKILILIFPVLAFGQANVQLCISCHGENGISPAPIWPNLAGQKEEYLILSMKAYRDGTRNDPLMSPVSVPLSDKDIEELAKYFSSLEAK